MQRRPPTALIVRDTAFRVFVRPDLDGTPVAIFDCDVFVEDTGCDRMNLLIAEAAAERALDRRNGAGTT